MKQVGLPYPVRQTLDVGNIKVVLLDVPVKEMMNENIYGLNPDGQIIWRVVRVPRTTENAPFVSIRIDKGMIRADSWDGVVVWLDPNNGASLGHTWHK